MIQDNSRAVKSSGVPSLRNNQYETKEEFQWQCKLLAAQRPIGSLLVTITLSQVIARVPVYSIAR